MQSPVAIFIIIIIIFFLKNWFR